MVERVATWCIVPHEERRVLNERRRWRHRHHALVGLVLALLFLGPFVVLGAIDGVLSFPVVNLFIVSFVSLGLFAHNRSSWAIAEGAQYRRALMKEHGAVDGWTVELTILQGAAPTGYDHGVVWVEDGRLFFVGSRTSFGLFASDLASNARAKLAALGDTRSITLPLGGSTVGGPVSLDLRPLDPRSRATAEATWAIRSWLDGNSVGQGQLPPLEIGPEAPTPSTLLARAIGVSILWAAGLPLALGLVTACASTWWSLPIVVPLLIGVLHLGWREFGTPFGYWRSWRDRRRLQ